jgi:hypothetical protein
MRNSENGVARRKSCTGDILARKGTVSPALDQAWELAISVKTSRNPKDASEKRRIKTMKTVVNAIPTELCKSEIKATGNRRIYSR